MDRWPPTPVVMPRAHEPSVPQQRIAHVALLVADYDEALAFYTGTLGFTVVEDTYQPLQDKRWVVIAPPVRDGAPGGGTTLLLARASSPEQAARVGDQSGGRVFLFLETDDFWRDHAAMTAAGVQFVRPPAEQPYGTVAVFVDLYGTRWDLVQFSARPRAASSPPSSGSDGVAAPSAHRWLLTGGLFTGAASLLHLAIIAGGPAWYRFFGAGEEMARLASRGAPAPALLTLAIALVLGTWSLYALSGAGIVRRLPFLRPVLGLVAVAYLARGLLGIPVVHVAAAAQDPYAMELRARLPFLLVTSAICLGLGLCYAVGAARLGARTRG